jgi:hypothetical protein
VPGERVLQVERLQVHQEQLHQLFLFHQLVVVVVAAGIQIKTV